MKELADKQCLFMIIASSDYIYGTNYQFCHGFVGKDLETLTQEKAIQAMGRIGRNNIQQNFTVRFRNDDIIKKLFMIVFIFICGILRCNLRLNVHAPGQHGQCGYGSD